MAERYACDSQKRRVGCLESPLPSCAPYSLGAVLFRSAVIFLLVISLVGCVRGPTHRETELTIRGLELYLAVLDEFKTERGEGIPVNGQDPIDAIVARYIPPGTSFQDAVAILNGGHFTVGRPKSVTVPDNHGNKTERFVVQGDLQLVSVFVLGGTSVYVTLDTDRPNPEPTIVKRAGGFIRSTYL